MRLGKPHAWIGLASVAGFVAVAAVELARVSPGALAAAHARVEDLAGRGGCSECHGGWGRGMTASCLDCHETIDAQMQGGEGLHGRLAAGEGSRCALCHSDHHGADFAMVNRQSFAYAGVADPAAFDHALVGLRMEGRHLDLACGECHENAHVLVLPPGGRRFLGLESGCGSCHEDSHEGRMALACASCHGQESFGADGLAAPDHGEHLPLVGGHGALACDACHEAGGERGLEAVGSRPDAHPARACADCHDSPHDEAFVTGVAELEGLAEGASCGACHLADHELFREESLEVGGGRHACSGFPLDPPHDQAACADCHEPAAGSFEERYPGRDADACERCHEDPHEGQFAATPRPVACLGCHERERFEPHGFGTDDHARTALALDGSHAELECAACHALPEEGGARVFCGTPAACSACHADAHGGFFGAVAEDGAGPDAPGEEAALGADVADCDRCHGTTRFEELPPGGFDHGRWCGFPLRGAHAQAACESCHPRSREPDETGRRFGRVEVAFGPFEGCATCHPDPHGGEFDGPGVPADVDGRAGCARCHGETSFRAFPGGFEHGRWTGFPLEGAHAEAGCAECHGKSPPPAPEGPPGSGRTLGLAPGAACADCHADPHAGQFATGPAEAARTDCSRCHEGAASFAELSFQHDFDSRFVLGEAHADLDCSACHFPVEVGGVEVVRYRPLGRRCTGCHDSDPDPLRRLRRKGG